LWDGVQYSSTAFKKISEGRLFPLASNTVLIFFADGNKFNEEAARYSKILKLIL